MSKLGTENKANAISNSCFEYNNEIGQKMATDSQQERIRHTESNNHVGYEVLRAIQEERSVFWEMKISIFVRRKVNMNACLILNGYWGIVVWISRHNSVRFLFVGLDEELSLRKNGRYRSQITCSHFGCCCHVKKREGQLRLTTRDLGTRVGRYTEVDGVIFEHLLWTVTNLSFSL